MKNNELRVQVLKSGRHGQRKFEHMKIEVKVEHQIGYCIQAGNIRIKSKWESIINTKITVKALKKGEEDRGEEAALVMAIKPSASSRYIVDT